MPNRRRRRGNEAHEGDRRIALVVRGYDVRKLIEDVQRAQADDVKEGRLLISVAHVDRPVSPFQKTRFG